mgnify:FL=1
MHIKYTPILAALLLASSFNVRALNIGGAPANNFPNAKNDYKVVVIVEKPSATGNVSDNDLYGTVVTFNQSAGKYGYLDEIGSGGTYHYTLYSWTDNSSLPDSGSDTDSFSYTLSNDTGLTSNAQLIIQVNENPVLVGGPIARDDINTVIPNEIIIASGDLTANDSNGNYIQLSSSPSSDYGVLVVSEDGKYNYNLYLTSPNVIDLKAGEVVTDIFNYQYFADNGESSTANLTVTIIGNPVDSNGDTIFDQPYNIDVEPNNRSAQATPLTSGKIIKGHLYDSEDKDWFSLSSAGDEKISLEVCPPGTNCFNKKSWVLYVFDSKRLKELNDQGRGENGVYTFKRLIDETASTNDPSGVRIINGTAGTSNHMYLAYSLDYFKGALIGIVNPCFGTLNTVDIGVPAGKTDYLIAISSPLQGDAGDSDTCGVGSVILQQAGEPAPGHEAPTTTTITIEDPNDPAKTIEEIIEVPGEPKSYATTEEHIVSFPYSDDQYAIKITGTGLINPLNSKQAIARSSIFDSNTHTLHIPRVRINENIYAANLQQGLEDRSTENGINFILTDIEELSIEDVVEPYRATFNPNPKVLQVMIPRVTHKISGIGYSVVLQYHVATEDATAWFDVISIEEIQ